MLTRAASSLCVRERTGAATWQLVGNLQQLLRSQVPGPVPQNPSFRTMSSPAPPKIVPPFTEESARAKVQFAEDAWNSKDPERVSKAYTEDSDWRNRTEFFVGREAIKDFLRRKWAKELDYKLMKELWCYTDNRIAVRFEYEWHNEQGQWFRTHGNELWEFDSEGLMRRRDMSANDYEISEADRRVKVDK